VSIIRSERWSAVLLIVAAAVGLVVANTGIGPSVIDFTHVRLGVPGFGLSIAHWVTDGLLAIFFFLAAIELKHELTGGELSSVRKAVVPAAAAVGGVIAPALIYLAVVHDARFASGWPIPTATDVAFALGVLALAGRRLPTRVRALLLALAVLDDLIAILIIAFFFTSQLSWLPLVLAMPVVGVFGWLSRRRQRPWTVAVLVLLGLVAWVLVTLSGIHPTIAGVGLGLVMARGSGSMAKHALDPVSNGIVLPVFAFVAALVAIPAVGIGSLSPAFWAIVLALPLGKLIGITAGASVAIAVTRRGGPSVAPIGDIVVVAALGGIGFTVSLLMNQLAWRGDSELTDEGTIAVIVASVLAAIIGTVVTTLRSRRYR
jgi:NhaA family Na+:H+ antiporter